MIKYKRKVNNYKIIKYLMINKANSNYKICLNKIKKL